MDTGTSKEVIHKISENLNKESTAAIVRTLLKLHKYGGTTEDKLVDTLVIDENVPIIDAKLIVQSVLMAGVEFGAIVKVPDIVYKLDDEFYSFLVDYYSQNYEKNSCSSKTSQRIIQNSNKKKNVKRKLRVKRHDSNIEQNKRNYRYKVRKRKLIKKVKRKRRGRKKDENTTCKKQNEKKGFWSTFWNLKQPSKKEKYKFDMRSPISQMDTGYIHSSYNLIKARQIKNNMNKFKVQPNRNINLNNTDIMDDTIEPDLQPMKEKYLKIKKDAKSLTIMKSNRKKESETEKLAAFEDKNLHNLLSPSECKIIKKIKNPKSKTKLTKKIEKYHKFMASSVGHITLNHSPSKSPLKSPTKSPSKTKNITSTRTTQYNQFMQPWNKTNMKWKSTPKLFNSSSNRAGHQQTETNSTDKSTDRKRKVRYAQFMQQTLFKKKCKSDRTTSNPNLRLNRNGGYSITKVNNNIKQNSKVRRDIPPLSTKSVTNRMVQCDAVSTSKMNKKQQTNYQHFMNPALNKKNITLNETSKTLLKAISSRARRNHREGTCSVSRLFLDSKNTATHRKSRSRTRCRSKSRRRRKNQKFTNNDLDTYILLRNGPFRKTKSDSVLVIPEKGKLYAKSLMKIISQKKSLCKALNNNVTKNTVKQALSRTKVQRTLSKTKNKEQIIDNVEPCPPAYKILEPTTLPVGTLLSSMGMGDMKHNWKNIKSKLNKPLVYTKNILDANKKQTSKKKRRRSKRRRKKSKDKTKHDRKNYAEELKGRKKGPYSTKSEKSKTGKKETPTTTKNITKKSGFSYSNLDELEKLLKTKNQPPKRSKSLDKSELSPRCITNALEEWCRLKKRLRKRCISKTEVNLQTKKRKVCSDDSLTPRSSPPPKKKNIKRKFESSTSLKSKEVATTLKKKRKVCKELKDTVQTSFTSLPEMKDNTRYPNKKIFSETSFLTRKHAGVRKKKRKQEENSSNALKAEKSKTPTYFFPFLRKSKRRKYERKMKREGQKYSNAYKNQYQSTVTPAYHSLKRMLRRLF